MGRKYTYATKTDLEKLVARMQKTGIICSEAVRELKKQFIIAALQASEGNRTRAAYVLGVHVNTLARQIRILGIQTAGNHKSERIPSRAAAPCEYELAANGS
jgi:DNA-binding NtrC family response regulator